MNSQDQNRAFRGFLVAGIAISLLIGISAIKSPRSHLLTERGNLTKDSKNIQKESDIYKNLGLATKSIFFHELKKKRVRP